MYNAVIDQVFWIKIVQFCQFLNTACFVTDSSPIRADKKEGPVWIPGQTNKQKNKQTNKQQYVCCFQTLHDLATGRSWSRLKLLSYLTLEVCVPMSYYSLWGILADYRDVLFDEMKDKIGWALAPWQFMNPSTNKQTNKQVLKQKCPRNFRIWSCKHSEFWKSSRFSYDL